MTASRTCRVCGADLPGDVPWCLRCFEPVRHLSPREPQLPTPADLEPIDPALVRRDHIWIRLDKPVYSRVRAGPTTFGLWGRCALTALVLAMLPWGSFTATSLFYLIGYLPVAGILLAAIWRREAVGPPEAAAIVHDTRAIARIRAASICVGVALVTISLADGAGILGYLPSIPFLATGLFRSMAEVTAEAIDQMQERPTGTLVLLNALNVVDAILSDAAIGAGIAREVNPIVLAIGPVAKLALVAALGAALRWRRPRALVWPTLAFAVLAAYHLTGLFGALGTA